MGMTDYYRERLLWNNQYGGRVVHLEREEDRKRGFCRFCGASIPHRFGEGRCDKCAHWNTEASRE
jgi:hypothetical protein